MTVSSDHFISKNCRVLCCLQGLLVIVFLLIAPRICSIASAQSPSKVFFPQVNPGNALQGNTPVGLNPRFRTLDQHDRFTFRKEPGLMLKNQQNTADNQLIAENQRQAERRGAWIVPTLYALGGVLTLGGLYVMLREENETTPAVRARIFPKFSGGGAQANIHIRF